MKYAYLAATALILTLFSASCKKENKENKVDDVVVINASGDINDELAAFRHLLGDQLNTTTGMTSGRREINWDGVPDTMVGKPLPINFFNPTDDGAPVARQRGLAYGATGEFRVSNLNFAEVNSQA